ncbi:MAG: hypothetical protein C5B43_01915 [Verrucomicrobia bacterium]|nr:MAG: hypothetical protein C5B43_01915 [Verrucomicrobiota bacterium]
MHIQKTLIKITIIILFFSLKNIVLAEDANNNLIEKQSTSFYNPNAQRQSVMYEFLYMGSLIEVITHLVEENNACNYCALKNQQNFESQIIQKFLEILNVNDNCLLDAQKENENCNLCTLLKEFPYRDLFSKLYAHLGKKFTKDYEKLRDIDSNIADELYRLFVDFNETENLNNIYNEFYFQIQAMGNFPNTLDYIILSKNTWNEILVYENIMKTLGLTNLITSYTEILALHKKFIQNNDALLQQMQILADREFKDDNGNELETFSEIIVESEKMLSLKLKIETIIKDML